MMLLALLLVDGRPPPEVQSRHLQKFERHRGKHMCFGFGSGAHLSIDQQSAVTAVANDHNPDNSSHIIDGPSTRQRLRSCL